ncbi:hypothetical protein NDK50_00625 [Paraburkholderia bryophila]|nr:hypothetical protein [Paraburkholderia bryophila]WCM20021.1 hypothetical protein NDK50_00625 [Paraburkholderia bryophila]
MHRHNDPLNRPGAAAGSPCGRYRGLLRFQRDGGVMGIALFGIDRRD